MEGFNEDFINKAINNIKVEIGDYISDMDKKGEKYDVYYLNELNHNIDFLETYL